MIYCRSCKKFVTVVGFHRDDPKLSCGHVKQRTAADDEVMRCTIDLEKILLEESKLRGIPVEQVKEDILNSLINGTEIPNNNIAYCDICSTVVSVINDIHNVRRCGGNLVDNPGCGCIIMPSGKKRHFNAKSKHKL
jgi:hypothetical protein